MSDAEKQEIIRKLRLVKSHMEPLVKKRIAETRHTYDEMMKGISKINSPDLEADLTGLASKLLGYVEEHKAPLDALNNALAYAEETEAFVLTRERIKEISAENGWLDLKNL